MEQYNKIQEYMKTVCEEVRYKRSHDRIQRELKAHIEDQIEAYKENGMLMEDAVNETIKNMGDPISLGVGFNSIHKPKSQKHMIGIILLLSAIGYILQLKLGMGYDNNLTKTFLYFTVGISLFLGMYNMNMSLLAKYSTSITFLAPLVVTFVVIIDPQYINGLPYFAFGPINIAGTTIIHIFPIFYGLLLFSLRKKFKYSYIMLSFGTFMLIMLTLILAGFQEYIFMTITSTIILYYAIVKGYVKYSKKLYALCLMITHVASWFVLRLSIFGVQNFKIEIEQYFLVRNPYTKEKYATFIGELIRGMKLIGKGKYNMDEYFVYKPSYDTTYMLLSLMNRYGIFIGICLLMMIGGLLFYGISKIKKQRGILSKLLSLSIIIIIATEMISHILYNLRIVFANRAIIPFVSRGFGDYVIYMFLFGLLLSIYRDQGIEEQDIMIKKKNIYHRS